MTVNTERCSVAFLLLLSLFVGYLLVFVVVVVVVVQIQIPFNFYMLPLSLYSRGRIYTKQYVFIWVGVWGGVGVHIFHR